MCDNVNMCDFDEQKVCDNCNKCFVYGCDVALSSGPNWEGD